MSDTNDPSKEVGFQLAFDGSFSLSLAPDLLKNKRNYLEGMEVMLDAAEFSANKSLAELDWDVWSFRSQLRESFVVAVVAYLEHLVLSTCDDLAVVLRSKIGERDFEGNGGFVRAKIFLEKDVNQEGFDKKTWDMLERYRTVRNIIAHSGHLWVDKSKRGKIGSLPGMGEDERGDLELDRHFGIALIEFTLEVTAHLSKVAASVASRTSRFHRNS